MKTYKRLMILIVINLFVFSFPSMKVAGKEEISKVEATTKEEINYR